MRNRIIIVVQGGLVQSVLADGLVDAIIVDYDVDESDGGYPSIPQNDGTESLANAYVERVIINTKKVNELFNIIKDKK